jgi:hypothetical protein
MEIPLSEPKTEYLIGKTDYTDNKSLKYGIWAYFILLIFEGALRKWFLPSLATPLLVIRDPIGMWLLYKSWQRGLLPSTIYIYGMMTIGLFSIYTAMFTGHGNLIVALYGARMFLIYFPLMFVIGRVFDREDIIKLGRVMLWISLPMLLLICKQFYSGQSAWVNRGVAGDMNGAGFSGSGDFMRPPGTFSFTSGVGHFFGLVAPFVFYFWFNMKQVNKWLLFAASGAMLMAIPFSISRTLFFEVCLTTLFAVLASMRRPENFNKVVIAMVVGVLILAVLSQTKYFTTATGAFKDRLTTADETEGGLVKGVFGDRFFGGMLGALAASGNQPFWGAGTGMGTNVGSILLTGKVTYLIAEMEWGRLIGEMGPLMGILVILLRVGFVAKITIASFGKMITGDLLPWLLLSFGAVIILQGQWAQPTILGFSTLIGGLILAALRTDPIKDV